jgi:hypothetical protein
VDQSLIFVMWINPCNLRNLWIAFLCEDPEKEVGDNSLAANLYPQPVIPRLACPVKREACFTGDRGIHSFHIFTYVPYF